MSYDSNNIFAKILRGEIPCTKIYEDEKVLAFEDIHPKAPVHILLVPKGDYINFHDFHEKAPADLVTHFYKKASELVTEKKLGATGYRIISNCGINGGQEVPHYHVHILGGCPLGAMIQPKIL